MLFVFSCFLWELLMPTRVQSLLGGNTQFVIHSGHDALHLA